MNINACVKCGANGEVVEYGSSYYVRCAGCENAGPYASIPSWAIRAWNKYNPAKSEAAKTSSAKPQACPICGHVPDITDDAQISRWNNIVANLS